MTGLIPVDRNASSVVEFLEKSKWALDVAVEMTGPAEVAQIKAQVVMAETYARELDLSKEIREQAREMVRRAEYALGRAIRKGQAEGTVRSQGQKHLTHDRWNGVNREANNSTAVSPKEFIPHTQEAHEIYAIVDNANPEEFEQALSEARDEGNVSRANVSRKVKKQAGPSTRDQRADLIAALAAQGYSSRQMPVKVGVTEESVRLIARDYGIEIPADKIVGRTRRVDWTNAVAQTVVDLENSAEFIQSHIDLNQVDFTEADEWVSSLTNSLRVLNRFVKQIKEKTHV